MTAVRSARLPSDQRRRQLLDCAIVIFAEAGYHDTSMNAIATRAGVTKPVVYQHFPSKRELFLEVLDHVGDRLRTTVTSATEQARSPREQVHASVRAFYRFVDEEEAAFRLLFGDGSRRDPDFAAKVSSVEEQIAASTAERIEIDGLATEHREVLAHGIVGLTEATARRWLDGGRRVGVEEVSAQVAELAWGGLRNIGRGENLGRNDSVGRCGLGPSTEARVIDR